MAGESLSQKQQEILEFIRQSVLNKGYPPSVREIGDAVHLKSTSSVHSHLATLEKKGYIRKNPLKQRTIEIVDETFHQFKNEVVNIPVVGRVAAGEPVLAETNIENYFPISAEYLGQGEYFILEVHGDSMINAGIFDGDLLVIRKQTTACNGEIVVAMVTDPDTFESAATVKRFFKENGHIRLQPENDHMEPIFVDDCKIAGKVAGLYRSI